MIFTDETVLTVVERSSAPSAISHLIDADFVRVLDVSDAFEGRERVTKMVSTMPDYVRAVLARLYREDRVLWYT